MKEIYLQVLGMWLSCSFMVEIDIYRSGTSNKNATVYPIAYYGDIQSHLYGMWLE